MEDPKVRENRARRAAKRQRLELRKSRLRDPRAVDYGTYDLLDIDTDTVKHSGPRGEYGLTLDQVEEALGDPQR